MRILKFTFWHLHFSFRWWKLMPCSWTCVWTVFMSKNFCLSRGCASLVWWRTLSLWWRSIDSTDSSWYARKKEKHTRWHQKEMLCYIKGKSIKCSSSLQPVRVCVLGPPAVGKSTVSKHICQHYKLHYVTFKEAVSQLVSCPQHTFDAHF